jgi:hypothetical protein
MADLRDIPDPPPVTVSVTAMFTTAGRTRFTNGEKLSGVERAMALPGMPLQPLTNRARNSTANRGLLVGNRRHVIRTGVSRGDCLGTTWHAVAAATRIAARTLLSARFALDLRAMRVSDTAPAYPAAPQPSRFARSCPGPL